MKPTFLSLFFAIITSFVSAQTNVSGGIFTNTTWTKANSPYIVTDTVVVFPGKTLTIEPGVEVRFEDDMMLEIREASLIAIGTLSDSITFTSNSATPYPGSWDKVWFNGGSMFSSFSYCKFHYANYGIDGYAPNSVYLSHSVFSYNLSGCSLHGVSTVVSHCYFMNNLISGISIGGGIVANSMFLNNGTGIYGTEGSNGIGCNFIKCTLSFNSVGLSYSSYSFETISIVDSCTFSNNTVGINRPDTWARGLLKILNSIIDSNSTVGIHLGFDSIINCRISQNRIGAYDSLYGGAIIQQCTIEHNDIGMKWGGNSAFGEITCNIICNNSSYDFYYTNASNIELPSNHWCTTDSVIIASKIYDGLDNINYGLVTFMPVDSTQCYLAGFPTSISGIVFNENGRPANGVTLILGGDESKSTQTAADGSYSFVVASGGSYTITPSKSNDSIANNGISSIDVLLMRRHILGNGVLGSPYKIIAAAECNAIGDSSITTQDILLTRSLILGNATSYPANRLWQFVPSDYVYPDNNHPFPFPSSRTYTNITTNQTGQDFIGIKLGDVNESWDSGVH